MEAHAATVAAALPGWGITPARPAVVLGHSMGGAIACLLAEAAPDRVGHLVLAEANLTERDATYSRKAARAPSFTAFERQWPEDVAAWARTREAYRISDTPSVQERMVAAMRQTSARAVYQAARSLYALTADEDWWARVLALHAAGLPMSGVYGVRSMQDGTPPDVPARARIPTAIVHDAGHMMMLDNPAGFYAAVRTLCDAPATP